MAAGERKLLPAVREAAGDTLIVADGFSCRGQIRSGTSRRGLHLAQIIQMAIRDGQQGPAVSPPESGYVSDTRRISLPRKALAGAGAVAAGAAAAAAIRRVSR
jgi:hypothetical protein